MMTCESVVLGSRAMAVGRINHYSIRTSDLETTRRFYVEVVGLTVGPRPPFPFPGFWLYSGDHASPENAVVHVIGIEGADVAYARAPQSGGSSGLRGVTGPVDHIAFTASGLNEMRARLEAMNVPFRLRTVPLTGAHQIFLEDPAGIILELNYAPHELRAS